MSSSCCLGYHLARRDVGQTMRRLNAPPVVHVQAADLRGTIAHASKVWAWDPISQRYRSVSMTQRTSDVDERIVAMRSRIVEQLLHIQRLNDLGRDTSDASEVLDLMLNALAQMKEVKRTIRTLESVS
jgi:hypothetical protein